MKHLDRLLVLGALGAAALPGLGIAAQNSQDAAHAVFVMTNDADKNEVIAYERTAYGTLQDPRHYGTEGRGSGGTVDPLASQGALTLSRDGEWLFAVNAGSGTLSVFRVEGARLFLTDRIATEGSEPNSVTQHGKLVYVLNTAGASSVVGFYFAGGKLERIPDSLRYLSGNAVGSGSVAFSPDGRFLMATEKATNTIDVFTVLPGGSLSPITVNKNVGAGTFSATFAPNGTAIAAETGIAGATNASAISSYTVQSDGTLKPITVSLPTQGGANCWSVVLNNGRYVYTSNSSTSSIAGFAIDAAGELAALPGTIIAINPAGSVNLDIATSGDGRFLYSLNGAAGNIGSFAVDPRTGQLTNLGTQGKLPASAGFNGIAAN